MLVESILAGLQLVSSVTQALCAVDDLRQRNEVRTRVEQIEAYVADIHRCVREDRDSRRASPQVMARYDQLVQALRSSGEYSGHLTFRRTDRGTYIIAKKTTGRQRSILRDARGEYRE